MIATGTDIRPLEVLLFMRDVKNRSYDEQMKGRGTGTPAARHTKDHFVIIDAIGVEKSQKTDNRPLQKVPGLSLKEVLEGVAMGGRDEATLTTLANRLIRLDKQISEREQATFAEKSGGKTAPPMWLSKLFQKPMLPWWKPPQRRSTTGNCVIM
jgi:type I restriction enzyme R subunit